MVAAVARRRIALQNLDVSEFEADVLDGLRATPKHIPAKYFYDAAGSMLFERITELPEYYPNSLRNANPAAPVRRNCEADP